MLLCSEFIRRDTGLKSRAKDTQTPPGLDNHDSLIRKINMKPPTNLFYTESDEWLRPESDGTVTLGITDYAQGELGELVYVEVTPVGERVIAGGSFGVVESVKAVGELHSPVAGEIVAANEAAIESSALVNESPYEMGWLARLKPDQTLDTSQLMDATAYAAFRAS